MEVEGFLFQFCEVTSIGKNPQENLTFIDDNLKINKLSIYWLKTKSYVEKWRNFPINKISQIIWRFKIQKKNSATACSWFIFVFHPGAKVCHSKENMMTELVL
jgi:hypothetical protein